MALDLDMASTYGKWLDIYEQLLRVCSLGLTRSGLVFSLKARASKLIEMSQMFLWMIRPVPNIAKGRCRWYSKYAPDVNGWVWGKRFFTGRSNEHIADMMQSIMPLSRTRSIPV